MRNYGRLAERSKAAVLKTVDVQASGGSNPSPSASATSSDLKRSKKRACMRVLFFLYRILPRPSLRCKLGNRNGDARAVCIRTALAIPSPRFAGLLTNPSPSASASGYGSRRSQKGSLSQVPLPILFRTLPRPSLRYNIVHRNGDDSLRSSIPSSRRSSLRIPPLPQKGNNTNSENGFVFYFHTECFDNVIGSN